MDSLGQDIRYSLRTLAKQPGFVAVAVLSLALGMGVNTAVFSALDALLLRPLAVRDLDRAVVIYHATPETPDRGTSFPAFLRYRERTDILSDAMAFGGARPLLLSDGDRRDQVYAEVVTADFFSIANVTLQRGRPFERDVDRAADPTFVAVLSHRFWKNRFASDPDITGKTLVLNGRPFVVSGVAGDGFTGLDTEVSSDLWIPLTAWAHLMSEPGRLTGEEHWITTVARLKPGVSLEQARAAMAIAGQSLPSTPEQTTRVRSVRESISGSQLEALAIGGAAFAAGFLVLALACMNVTSLLLARAAARQREMAVRLALGSSRHRLLRLWVVDSLLISLAAGVAGLVLASWMLDLVVAFKPPVLIGQSGAPTLPLEFHLDFRVFAFALGLSILTAVVVGIVSGLQASNPRPMRQLKGDRRFSPGFNVRSMVIASQMALSLILLIPCGLFVRSWMNSSSMEPGFSTDNVLLLPISTEQSGVRVQKPPGFEQQLIERVALLPGVDAVTVMDPVPLWFASNSAHFSVNGSEARHRVNFARIGPNYFATLRIPLIRGRDFTASDNASAPPVAIINETLAREFWPDGNAVGRQIRDFDSVLEVVGIARNAKYSTLGEAPQPFLYRPLAQEPTNNAALSLAVRATGNSTRMTDAIEREVRALVPAWPAFQFRTLDEGLKMQQLLPRVSGTLLGVLGAFGLLLAAVGGYGVMAYLVKQRTYEIGIRLALGSPGFAVQSLVIKQGMAVCLAGAAVGVAGALAASQFLTGVLYGIGAADPLTYALAPLVLVGVALFACYLPARQVARINPLEALRQD